MKKNQTAKKRVVVISDNDINSFGGEQLSTLDVCRALSDDYDVILACPGPVSNKHLPFISKRVSTSKYKLLKLMGRRPFALVAYFFNLVRVVRQYRPDIVHTQSQFSFVALSLFYFLYRRDFKFIHTDRALRTKYRGMIYWLLGFCAGNLDRLVVTTNHNYALWKSSNVKKMPIISVVFNTIGEIPANDSRELFKGDSVSIGFAGRMVQWKGWDLAKKIIQSFSIDEKNTYNFKVAAGVNSMHENTVFETFQENLPVGVSISKNISAENMIDFYNDLDVFVVTSSPNSESFGRTVIEAMACGCIVFSTNCGGPVEIINNHNLIFNKCSEFKVSLEDFLACSESQDVVKKNLLNIHQRYSFSVFKSSILDLYEEVL